MSVEIIILIISEIGTAINVVGFLPQIIKLWKEKDSTGNSLTSWYMWLVANLILSGYAIYIKDPVFISLEVLYVVFITVTIILIHKYKKIKK